MSEPADAEGPPLRGTIRSGAFDLDYVVEGRGRPTLVIGSSVFYPRTFSPGLRRHLRLAFADHRGFARAAGPVAASDFAFDTILADMDLVRERLGFERMVVVGHSGHAYMALEYAKRYPRRVSHLVLIAAGPSQGPAHRELAERHWEEAVCPERKARLERDLALLPADIAADPDRRFVAFCIRMAARSWHDLGYDAGPLWDGVRVNMAGIDHLWGEVFRDIDIRDGIEALAAPVLLALGRFDYLVAPAHAWDPYRASFRDLTVRVFDRSGHTPQLEESRSFDEELLRWMAAHEVT